VTDISSPASFGALTTATTAESARNCTAQVALRLDFQLKGSHYFKRNPASA
jgi:hypothetical protein